jgi:hypothetical protein
MKELGIIRRMYYRAGLSRQHNYMPHHRPKRPRTRQTLIDILRRDAAIFLQWD